MDTKLQHKKWCSRVRRSMAQLSEKSGIRRLSDYHIILVPLVVLCGLHRPWLELEIEGNHWPD